MTADELRQKLELNIVEFLKKGIENGTITDERAQAISQHVLATLTPGMTLEEFYKAIPRLDDMFSELAPLIIPILADYERNVNQKAMETVRELIKQGQYDAAAKLGKQAVSQEIKLTWTGSSTTAQTEKHSVQGDKSASADTLSDPSLQPKTK